MGFGRIPNPYGVGRRYGCVLKPEMKSYFPDFYRDLPELTRGPMGTNNDIGVNAANAVAKEEQALKENLAELKRLVRVYGIVKNRAGSKAYVYWVKGKRLYRLEAYVKDRNTFFGSEQKYQEFLKGARSDLDADKGKLRRYIEPPPFKRKKVTDWKKGQDVFYAWVKKAYEKKLGPSVDIQKLIRSRSSEKLKKALKQVKLDYGKRFRHGGFNPRPMKRHGYRLGTISEHALGNAIDIDARKNAHILRRDWIDILGYTGKTLSHATRQTQWKRTPKSLYDTIKAINDLFVSKVAEAKKSARKEVKKQPGGEAGSDSKKRKAAAAPRVDPLTAAVKKDAALKKIGLSFVRKWEHGFFNLPWKLVEELHEEGFHWGATFKDPDLHHFEL